ncbi:MAG: NCS2 family permease [Clostridiales bacterium]|jgi:AGZA family xanthine/uracil permease-like MFS transporter|nr:NCS2 family permease [Clostridiales bacterium]
MSKLNQKLDNYFGVTKSGSSVKVEIYAGIATFLAMAYILATNPIMMQGFAATNDAGELFIPLARTAALLIATALGALLGTVLMAVFAKMPLAQAPGMGLNAMIGTLLLGSVFGTNSFTYANLMLVVLLSGVVFLALSFIPAGKDKLTGNRVTIREKVFDGIPSSLRTAIPVGIGLFIAFIGLKNAQIVIADGATLLAIQKFNVWTLGNGACQAIVALFGLVVIAVLAHYKVKGAVVIGILSATLLAMPLGVVNWDMIAGNDGVSWKFWENFGKFFSLNSEEGAFGLVFSEGFKMPAGSIFSVIVLIITFAMIDMFDTMGTLVGCATNAGLVDERGKPLNYAKVMYSDSIATVTGSIFGTSTVTTFVESGAGIAVGGKTGLTALVVAGFFFLSMFVLPIFAFIPSAAAASALIYVGVLMIGQVKKIDFTNIRLAVPAFITIIGMPLTYSITNGIGLGILSYVAISVVTYLVDLIKGKKNGKKAKWSISIVTLVIAALFLVYFLVPTV